MPVGVERVDAGTAQRHLIASALTTDELSRRPATCCAAAFSRSATTTILEAQSRYCTPSPPIGRSNDDEVIILAEMTNPYAEKTY